MNQSINNFNQQGNNETNNQTLNNGYYQNQNIGQNENVSQQQFNYNIPPQNNIYGQPNNQVNINKNNNIQKQNKIKIIGIVVAVVIIIIIGIMVFGGNSNSSGSNRYTVEYGKPLSINEVEGYYDFDIEVVSIEKNYTIYALSLFETSGIAVKVKIKNNSDYTLYTSTLVEFRLIDSSNNEIASASPAFDTDMNGSLNTEILSGETVSGYLFFYNIDAEETSNINDADISKLEISVPKNLNETNEKEKYYIMLNK